MIRPHEARVVRSNIIAAVEDAHLKRGVGFAVPAGTILGLLGPNGAGKTTAVRILTTLVLPDAGRAAVAGIDGAQRDGAPHRVLSRP